MKKKLSDEEKIKQVESKLDRVDDLSEIEQTLTDLWSNYSVQPNHIWVSSAGKKFINEHTKRKKKNRGRAKSKRC